mmetsp:Transcript_14353/g.2082  ORF Transcript_14353/g.2082 Transcript_14353/m.2082 type:complete len:94 (-) Transcript_14353:80-361(-)|eukprot:CAMPEP_0204821374 /NCGR_PEP_ID=MMETSP1018-20131115/11646_1 /ASSEMBLY_ACC=CAM_ASM_000518 /TAXON_ID=46462 /ORGANISM="Anophryoides haemophila, Strain AH6" /LENGTH=93 /DNA_ID=CAMNT_0051928275 /DNA_START=27 /DNA_END=308 /DNA_ORIENTATION=-
MAQGIKDILKDNEKLKQVTKATFELIDKDKSGFLEAKEIYEVIKNTKFDSGIEKPEQADVEEVLKELDENGDGKLSLDEFYVLIGQVLETMIS